MHGRRPYSLLLTEGKKMSKAAKTAFGGMATALSVVFMLLTVFDTLSISVAAMAGVIIMLCVIELSRGWAFGVWAATSIIGFLVVPNKEGILLYVAFFGYYPIIKGIIESKIKNRILEYTIKLIIYNAAVLAAEYIVFKVMNIPLTEFLDVKEGTWLAQYIMPILFVVLNLVFFLLDYFYTAFATAYINRWQKKFRKLFKFK